MAKQVTAIGPVEGPWALPGGWRWEALGSLGTWSGGGTPSKARPDFWSDGTVPWVSPKDMKRPLIDSSEDTITVAAVNGSSAKMIFAGSVLCVMRSGILRHTFPVAVNTIDVTLNQDMRALTPRSDIDPWYLAYYLRFTGNTVLHTASKAGTTVNSIEASRLDRHAVPVVDFDRQRAIVARINELFAEIDDGEAALARARDDLATWRKALLKAAVTGELTADWRVSHPPAETGAELMARILADRRKRWGMDPRNARKKYAEPNGIDIDPSETVSAGWAIASIEQVAFVENGQTPKGIDAAVAATGDIPWFKVSSMNAPGNVDLLTESKWWLSAASATKLGLRVHPAASIVFPKRGGSIFTEKKRRLGRAGSVDLNVMAVVPLDNTADHLWTFFRNLSLRAISDGSNVPQINYDDVADLRILLPPSEEAQEISARVESALAITSDVEADIDQFLFDAKMLRQSILAAAFRGDLA